MPEKLKYPLTKQFLSWRNRGQEERMAVIRELFDVDPFAAKLLREAIDTVANEPIGQT